ncbi:MAG: hypothetical protein AAF447_23350 [Myxococcota bacterium]
MRSRSAPSLARLVFALAALTFVSACSSSPAKSREGESCDSRGDCASGLLCVMGVCNRGDFPVTVAGGVCESVDCLEQNDCCVFVGSCQSDFEACEMGDMFACDQFQTNCCEGICVENICQPFCVGGTCAFGVCNRDTNLCVECNLDEDCPFGGTCTGNTCVGGGGGGVCSNDGDCGLFERCDGGTCVQFPCATDRECQAATGDFQSQCIEGECFVPCSNDADCADTVTGDFVFEVCQSGRCTPVGCETDVECRIQGLRTGGPRDAIYRCVGG